MSRFWQAMYAASQYHHWSCLRSSAPVYSVSMTPTYLRGITFVSYISLIHNQVAYIYVLSFYRNTCWDSPESYIVNKSCVRGLQFTGHSTNCKFISSTYSLRRLWLFCAGIFLKFLVKTLFQWQLIRWTLTFNHFTLITILHWKMSTVLRIKA